MNTGMSRHASRQAGCGETPRPTIAGGAAGHKQTQPIWATAWPAIRIAEWV